MSGYSSSPVVTLDAAGNALVTWGDQFGFRRYLPEEGWQAASSPDLGVLSRAGAVAPDGSIAIVALRELGPDQSVPAMVHFE